MADEAVIHDSLTESRSPESSLLDHLERVAHARTGRFAVRIYLSRLRPRYRQPHHVRIASRSFDTLLNSTDSQIYVLSLGDLVLMCRDVRVDDVDYMINKVRALFRNDPVSAIDRATGRDEFTDWYDLAGDYDDLRVTVQRLDARNKSGGPAPEDASRGQDGGREFIGQALDPAGLAILEDSLRQSFSDVEAFAENCRFRDCSHQNEPGCRVQKAVDQGDLAADRLQSYHKLQREFRRLAAKQDTRAAQEQKTTDKQFAKHVRNVVRSRRNR